MGANAEQVIKKRTHEYVRDTFILLSVLVVIVVGIVLAIKLIKKDPPSIVIYNESGEVIGKYTDGGNVTVPSKTGYSSSWVAESGNSYDSIEAAFASGETSVKQVFTPIEYTATIYLVGGTLADRYNYVFHEADEGREEYGNYWTRTYTILDDPFDLPLIRANDYASKRGSNFEFWSSYDYLGKNNTLISLKSTETKTVNPQVARDTEFYAVWSDIMCTVSIVGPTGETLFTESHKETSTLDEDELRASVEPYIPENFELVGFYSDSKLKNPYDFDKEIEQTHLTIYTKWVIPTYHLIFLDENGDVLQDEEYEANADISEAYYDYLSILGPGKIFNGWTFNNVAFSANTMPNKHVTLTPSITMIPYTITWYVDSTRSENTTWYYGDTPVAPSTLSTDKAEDQGHTYEFTGWSPSVVSVTDSATYTAQYSSTRKKYTYSVSTHDGVIIEDTTVDYGTALALPSSADTYYEGHYEYTFDKWVIENTDTTPSTVTDNMVIVATYTEQPRPYTVTWKDYKLDTLQVNNGQGLVDSIAVRYQNNVNLNLARTSDILSYTKKVNNKDRSFSFIGWTINDVFYASNDNSEINYLVEGDTTIYATYSDNSATSTYILHYDDETVEEVVYYVGDEQEAYADIAGISHSKSATLRYTYTFDGWYIDNGTTKLTSYSQLEIGDGNTIELYERFTSVDIIYHITWIFGDNKSVMAEYKYEETLDPIADLQNAGLTTDKASTISTVYTFSEWDYDSDIVTGDATYTAIYEESVRQYTYAFMWNDAVIASGEIDYLDIIPAPDDPDDYSEVDYSYAFAGWYANTTKFTVGTQITADVTYVATFNATINQYTCTFYEEDGETVITSITQDYGTSITNPSDPSKAQTPKFSYTFAGWEFVSGTALDGQTLKGNASYRATFDSEIRSYTYTFYMDDAETVVTSGTKKYDEQLDIDSISEPEKATDPNKYTFAFEEWHLQANYSDNAISGVVTITGDIVFYAKFTATPIKHTVTFKMAADGDVIDSFEVGYNEAITAPTPVKTYYDFVNWNTTVLAKMGTTDLTYYAIWEATTYHISYKTPEGDDVDTDNIKTFTCESDLTQTLALDAEKTGYTLDGWTYNNNTITTIGDAGVIGDLVIYADFSANPYTITYDRVKNAATLENSSKIVTYDSPYGELETPVLLGYTFVGWYLESNYQTAISDESIVKITASQTVYAKWILTTYRVHGYVGGVEVTSFAFDIEHEVNLTAYTNNGAFDFDSWYEEDVEDLDVTTFTPITSYGLTTGDITVYGIVKTAGLTIDGNTVTGYIGNNSSVIIPRMWNGVLVTTIESEAFMENNTIVSVDASHITTIKDSAFAYCDTLASIDLSSVETIESYAFEYCVALASIDLSSVETIERDAFANCTSLTSVDLSSATSIGASAFANTGITEITLSKDITSFGNYVFAGCNNITAIHFNGTTVEFEAILSGTRGNSNLKTSLIQ